MVHAIVETHNKERSMLIPRLKKADVIAYYGNNISAAARAINVRAPSFYSWGEFIPVRRAYEYERITNGSLKPEYIDDVTGQPVPPQ